jgi:hypothetical protein
MGHTVGDKAAQSVKKSEKVKKSERTPEQILKDTRNDAASGCSVPSATVLWLLGLYEASQETIAQLGAATAGLLKRAETAEETVRDLTAKNEEFRRVYETENRNMVINVGDLPTPEVGNAEQGS